MNYTVRTVYSTKYTVRTVQSIYYMVRTIYGMNYSVRTVYSMNVLSEKLFVLLMQLMNALRTEAAVIPTFSVDEIKEGCR